MNPALIIEPARPAEWPDALRLAFQHLSVRDQAARTAAALDVVAKKEIDPDGIFVARSGPHLVGVLICTTTPGAGSLVWPPQVVSHANQRDEIEDQLLVHATAWLRQRGAKLAQTMLPSDEAHLAAPLERHDFRHVTSLWYLRLDLGRAQPEAAARLTYHTYPTDPERFHQTLLQTYEGTDDCPELTGVRDIREIIEGHRTQGEHDPERWWLACRRDEPVGVLLLARMVEWQSWDVAYVGVTAASRRRGFGREMMNKAAAVARQSGVPWLTLSVDRRNRAAWGLYENLGFTPFDEREVFLAIWKRHE